MANIFYQGEDITLNIELFEDDSETPISFTGKEVTIIAYTDKDGKNVTLSTKTNTITRDNEFQLTGTIQSEDTKELLGVMFVEMLVEQGTSKRISVKSDIVIEPSKVGFL